MFLSGKFSFLTFVWCGTLLIMQFDHATLELIQVLILLIVLLFTHKENTAFSNGVLLWFACSLSFDVFVLHCIRPHYVAEGYNSINVLLGWVFLYEKSKVVFRPVVVFVVSLFR